MSLLFAICQLCHTNKDLSHKLFLQLFPRLWKLFPERQQSTLAGELGPFLSSGTHNIQRDCHPSSIHTFVEALLQCMPAVPLRPTVLMVSERDAGSFRVSGRLEVLGHWGWGEGFVVVKYRYKLWVGWGIERRVL